MNNEPVAWWTGKFDDESEDFIFSDTRQKFIDHPIAKNHLLFSIPLYTHPAELTDEEIHKIWASENGLEDMDMCKYADFLETFRFVEKAILRKAQEK